MPIKDSRGQIIGYSLRRYPALCKSTHNSGLKVISYWNDDCSPKIHFQRYIPGDTRIVLVEDILSAIKVSRYLPCAALLGTNLTDEIVYHLLEFGINDVFVALDGDAWKKAAYMQKEYMLLFRNFDIITWSNQNTDPKDMDDSELEAVFRFI